MKTEDMVAEVLARLEAHRDEAGYAGLLRYVRYHCDQELARLYAQAPCLPGCGTSDSGPVREEGSHA